MEQFPFQVDALVNGDRDVFIKNMRKKYRMSPILAFKKSSGYLQSGRQTTFAGVYEKTANKGLWFPSGEWDGSVDIERVIQATKEFFE